MLGPLELRVADINVDLGSAKQRTVLAVLLADLGRPVPQDLLIDRVWGDAPPAEVRNALYTYVTRLRRILACTRQAEGGKVELVRQRGGYLIDADPALLDLNRHRCLAERARAVADSSPERACHLFRQAADLWRGEPLAGLPGDWAARVRERLVPQRLGVLAERANLEIGLGRADRVIDELQEALTENELFEPLSCQLIRALWHAGRSAEALECYARVRRRIADEFGVEPGARLRRLHEAILQGTLEATAPVTPAAPAGSRPDAVGPAEGDEPPATQPRPPCLLPAAVGDLTGRDEEAELLCQRLTVTSSPPSMPVVAVLGMGGLGKTVLAVHVAHRLREHFDDGQLYVDLHGQQRSPVDPDDALARFLRALGVADSEIPLGLDARAELYRSLLADRRVLVVLDGAADESQIEPLLPGSGSCGVLITSRARLAALSCTRLHLSVLEVGNATRMLARIVGDDRASADPVAARELVRLCGYLPLAVRVAAARLVAHPHWKISGLVSRLVDERHRIAELHHGALEVRGSFDLSYQRIDPQARQLLRRLGLLGRSIFSSRVVEQVLRTDQRTAEGILDRLIDAQMLDVAGTGPAGDVLFRLHELVRIHARDRAEHEESGQEIRRITALGQQVGDRPAAVNVPAQAGTAEDRGGIWKKWPAEAGVGSH
ncbi:BTAD domain-containing putative transcriptional regulator [Frankia sp. CiP1_Cm_nod2]|uniref:BTAD domain-containing putative transcriptional regulator n=1 Tax=Frankia sp. CiP1_Cm_nod2 TaxID=2897161 RepID=UPI002025B007